jgi:hypothetical protein
LRPHDLASRDFERIPSPFAPAFNPSLSQIILLFQVLSEIV